MPPRSEPNAKGIKNKEGGRLFFLAIFSATGIIRANAPMLFINAELTVTANTRKLNWIRGLLHGHQARKTGQEQRRQGHDIVAPLSPYEKEQHDGDQ
ncbi:MAG: hypothetical protein PHC36_08695 [Eubacteriales bacterium]|nr:hypothetical protein [Eubacteriales bacterium]